MKFKDLEVEKEFRIPNSEWAEFIFRKIGKYDARCLESGKIWDMEYNQREVVPLEDKERTVPALSFVELLAVNAYNRKLTAHGFRELVRNTLPIVQYDPKALVKEN